MSNLTGYVGSTLNYTHLLKSNAMLVQRLSDVDSLNWNSPAKLQLVDNTGVVWHEELLLNPTPIIIGSDITFEYEINMTIPDAYPGTYSLTVSRSGLSSTEKLLIEGLAQQAYGAADVLGLQSDTNIVWSLLDTNPNATVTWDLNFTRITSQAATAHGTTIKQEQGNDTLFISQGFNPMTEAMPVSLNPKTIIWSIEDMPGRIRRQTSALFIVSNSQLTVISELKNFFDRLCQEKRLPSLEYTLSDYTRWCQQGMDMFNAQGLFTTFTMINATDGIRYWWYICSIICALRSMYMYEGQRSFNFSGQSVTLDVDITPYLQSMADTLQGQWDSEKLTFKQQLKQYGLTGGDGNMATASFQYGAVGLSLGPASNFGGFYGARNILGGIRFF